MFFYILHFKCAIPLSLVFVGSNLKSDVNIIGIPLCLLSHAFLRFSLSLAFNIFITRCLGVNLFVFILFGNYCASYMRFFIKFEDFFFLVSVSLNIFSVPFSIFSLLIKSITNMLLCLILSQIS